MSFTDDFTNTGGTDQLLSARSGWTLAFGQDCLGVPAGGTTLAKFSPSSTNAFNAYYRPDDSGTDERAGADLLNANIFVFVLGSGSTAATFNGYGLRLSGTTALRVYKIINGDTSGTLLKNVTGLTSGVAAEVRASVSGSTVTISVYQNGVQVGTSAVDSTSAFTTGRRGLLTLTTGVATSLIDNYQDNYTAPTALAITPPAVPFYEGVRNTSVMPVIGTYTGSLTSIEARLIDANGNAVTGFDWSTKVASPSGNAFAFSFSAVPIGGPYRVQVRDSAVPGTITTGGIERYVGAIIVVWGQSQSEKLFTDGSGTVTVTAGAKAFGLIASSKSTATAPAFGSITSTNGAGIVAAVNQYAADTGNSPIMVVDDTYSGTSIQYWIDNTSNTGGATSYGLWDFSTTMLNAMGNRASIVHYMQGTADASAYSSYAAKMETLKAKFLVLIGGTSPLFAVTPQQRSASESSVNQQGLREAQYGKANSGGDWRVNCWLQDWEMGGSGGLPTASDANTSPHQSTNPQGNKRGGTRIGRGWAKHAYNATLDIDGPQIVTADFTSAARTAIDVTFDRDIKTPAGVTTGIANAYVSLDNGATWPNPTNNGAFNATAAIVSARVLRLTSTGSAFPLGATRYETLRFTPFSGDEANVEANYLSKVLCDTTSFDGGRGMPARPVMGTGLPVALAIPIVATNATGTATLRVRQAA